MEAVDEGLCGNRKLYRLQRQKARKLGRHHMMTGQNPIYIYFGGRSVNIPRILIAAPSSGSGKTVISCGLMAAFCRQQKNVVSCKCGPDYIDPMFHREVLGIDSQNLDLFFCEKEQLTGIFAEHAKNVDLAVVEGVMGYYDGMGLDTAKASSYDVAAALQIPVVLVVSARGSALSLAALVKGFLEFKRRAGFGEFC